MIRDYTNFDKYYSELLGDIYAQPQEEDKHFYRAKKIIDTWLSVIHPKNVLDVGCGEGFCQEFFEQNKVPVYIGVCLGEDYKKAIEKDRNVIELDFNFLGDIFQDNSMDMVFSRHSLEHSPFPLLSLMEWHRVARKWLGIVVPNPKSWTFMGRNHYSVIEHTSQLRWLLRRAGWKVIDKHCDKFEYCFLCEKKLRVSYEGWTGAPLSNEVYEADRDNK